MKLSALWLLPSLLVAALWSLNARLSNPPLSQTDWQLRTAIAGADRMEVRYFSCQRTQCLKNVLEIERFSPTQLAQFRKDFRFLDGAAAPQSGRPLQLGLYFYRGRNRLAQMTLSVGQFTTVSSPALGRAPHRLHPRFEARLRARLPLSRIDH